MKQLKIFTFFSIVLFCIAFSIVFIYKKAQRITPLTINSNIDGYYISKNFGVWKIYTKNDKTFMEEPLLYSSNYEFVFEVLQRTMVDGNLHLRLHGTPNPGNPNPEQMLNCIIHINNNKIYLDVERRIRKEEKEPSSCHLRMVGLG